VTTIDPWFVSVEGPGGFVEVPKVFEGEAALKFVIPQSGRYSFSVGPNTILGNRGQVSICAEPQGSSQSASKVSPPPRAAPDQQLDVAETAFRSCLDKQAKILDSFVPGIGYVPGKLIANCYTEWWRFHNACLRTGAALPECAKLTNALALRAAQSGGRSPIPRSILQ
jgi:hypothetical protein